jgi:hypothetical protein
MVMRKFLMISPVLLLTTSALAACEFDPGVSTMRELAECMQDHLADFVPGDVSSLLNRVTALEESFFDLEESLFDVPDSSGPTFATGASGTEAWVAHSENGIYVDVDTSAAGFESTPNYITSIHGTSSHWTTTGGNAVYNATPTGFRVYIYQARITPELATEYGWHIEWVAVESE